MGVLRTEKATTKACTYASDDNVRRCRELWRGLHTLVDDHGVALLCAESMSFPRQASVAAKMSLAWGVVSALAESLRLPLVQASPQAIKLAVCGDKSASKESVQDALDARFGLDLGSVHLLPNRVCIGQWEHCYDALAAVVALSTSDVFRMAQQNAKEALR